MAQDHAQAGASQARRGGPGGFQANFPTLLAEAIAGDERPIRLATYDEARFGRINRPVRCWAPAGIRPVVSCQIVREYVYLFSAVCPTDGTIDSLILPTMQTECFQLFIDHVAREHPDHLNVLLGDGAACHHATELTLPDNIRILTLPPYSPELNPTEQVWDLIRERHFANRTFDSLDEVEAVLGHALHELDDLPIQLQTLTTRDWLTTPT